MNCKCGTSAVFCTVTTNTCRCTPTGVSTTLSKNWTYHVDDLHNRDVDHLVSILQLRAPVVAQQRACQQPPNCTWSVKVCTVGTCLCVTTEMSNTLRHLQLEPLGLLELVVVEHRDVHNRGSAPQNAVEPVQGENEDLHPLRRLPPQPPTQEPTLGLLGAAPDRCNNVRRSLCTGLWGPRGRGSLSRRRRHATATSSGQQLPKECHPSSDPARCPCRPLGPPGCCCCCCCCGGAVVVVVSLWWWCRCGGGVVVVVSLWWCRCGGVVVVVSLWWCRWCGVVVVVSLVWCRWCGGGVVVVVLLWWCCCCVLCVVCCWFGPSPPHAGPPSPPDPLPPKISPFFFPSPASTSLFRGFTRQPENS